MEHEKQELFPATHRQLGLRVQAGMVHRERGTAPQLLGQREVLRVNRRSGLIPRKVITPSVLPRATSGTDMRVWKPMSRIHWRCS